MRCSAKQTNKFYGQGSLVSASSPGSFRVTLHDKGAKKTCSKKNCFNFFLPRILPMSVALETSFTEHINILKN